jgi:glycerophosphoryl diester phosphodiesterase
VAPASFSFPAGPPLICAHACSVEGAPNTLAGLQALIRMGIEMVEFDVRRSADGVLVAHHDDRLPDGRPIGRLGYEQIVAAYPPEARPAKIAELLDAAAGSMRLQLDLKEHGVEEDAVELALAAAAPSEIVLTTLLEAQVHRLKRSHPNVTVGLSLNRSPASFLRGLARARRCHADLLAIHYLHLHTPLPARAAKLQLPLFIWTVDNDGQLIRALRDPSVACVITNRPGRARELRAATALTDDSGHPG